MENVTSGLFGRHAVLALTAAIVLSVPAWAQRMPIRRVLMTSVKNDRAADFEAAIRQYNAVLAKIPGARSRLMFQSLTGPYQFMMVRDYEKWSDLDPGPVSKAIAENAELAAINLRIGDCVESSTLLVEELLPDLSMPLPSEPPVIVRFARSRIRPDKVAEFEALVKNELLPANRKAGSKSFTIRRVRFGGPTNDYYLSTRLAGWVEIGNDSLRKSMGDEAYQKMVAKLTAVTLERELNLYRFRSDLSYGAAPGTVPSQVTSR